MMARLHEAGDGMAESTGTGSAPSADGGDASADPRYPAAFQRGYDGREPERRSSGEERLRRKRPSPVVANRPQSPREDGPRNEAVRRIGAVLPTGATAPTDRNDGPLRPARAPEPGAVSDGKQPEVLPAAPDDQGAAGARSPVEHPVSTRRLSGSLAVVGAVCIALGLLALWRSSQTWFDYRPSQGAFGPEQYLRVLSESAVTPCLTVGLVALGLAVVLPLLRAARR
jgi:hypothetical protein